MISASYSVDMFKFNAALKRFWAYSHKTIGQITIAQARLFAVQLATQTQPFGSGDDARFKGQNAVRRDIGRVFISADKFDNGEKHGLRAWIASAIRSGKLAEARTAVRRLTGRDLKVSENIDRAHHRGQRNARGRVNRGAVPMLITKPGAVEKYTKEKEKLVGFGKSGWAQAARDLGGTRGIPGWVSRNRGPGEGKDMTRSSNSPRVELINSVRYASDIIDEKGISNAARIQAEKMEKAIEHALLKEAGAQLAS